MLALLLCGCSDQVTGAPAGAPVEFDHYVNWTLLDHRQLLFRSNIDGDWDIYLADGLTDQLRRVTADRHHNRYADPSPDGRQVVYASNADGGDFDLYLTAIDGSKVVQLTANDLEDYSPVFAPDGISIAFERDVDYFQLFLADLGTGIERQLTADPWHSYAPDWSPNGATISYFANRDGDFDIFSVPTAGGRVTKLANTAAFAQFPDFDPSGRWICFEAFDAGDWDLYRVDIASGQLARLTKFHGHDRDPDWSPGGSQIAFSRQIDGHADIWLMAADGSSASRLIATAGSDFQPVWVKAG